MSERFNVTVVAKLRQRLDGRSIYAAVQRFINELVPKAPTFHYQLKRHIHPDEDLHAPLTLRLRDGLRASDPLRIAKAKAAACQAIEARIRLWDGVLTALPSQRHETPTATCLN